MGGTQSTVTPDQFAGASTPRNVGRGSAGPSPSPFTATAGQPFNSPGESLSPAQGPRAQSGLLAPARRATPAISPPGEAGSSRHRSLLDPPAGDAETPPRRNDVLPGGFGGQMHVMSGEDAAANGRLAKTLTGTGDFTTLAPILRGALRDNPARASVELAELSRQTHALDKQSGAKLDRILDAEAKALGLPSPIAQKPAPRQAASLAPTTMNDAGGPAAAEPGIEDRANAKTAAAKPGGYAKTRPVPKLSQAREKACATILTGDPSGFPEQAVRARIERQRRLWRDDREPAADWNNARQIGARQVPVSARCADRIGICR